MKSEMRISNIRLIAIQRKRRVSMRTSDNNTLLVRMCIYKHFEKQLGNIT